MSIMNLSNNMLLAYVFDKSKEYYYKYFISDEKIIKKRFRERLGRDVNLNNPVKYNDKLQWLKLNWYDPLATKCADKFEVRNFIKETIGSQYLNELLGVYNSVNDINLDELPKSFVLKGTHGSGYNIICKDKKMMDWDHEFKKMRRWLWNNYYYSKKEWVYKEIKPRIICEKFIEQEEGAELRDYRFFCFNGKPKFISVDLSITDKNKTRRNIYDLNWNLLEGEISYPKELDIDIPKPSKLEEMLALSQEVSKPFPHARIDFYQVKERIIFGEITFFHQSGMGKFNPSEFETQVGEYLQLPKKKLFNN